MKMNSTLAAQLMHAKLEDMSERHKDVLSPKTLKNAVKGATIGTLVAKTSLYTFLVYIAALFAPVAGVLVGAVMLFKMFGMVAFYNVAMREINAYFSEIEAK